jgi:hypothetical protein
MLERVALRKGDVIVPSTALAQAWRGRRSQALLSKVLNHCVVASFDPVAREVGELCGRARSSDIVDAHVALVASRRADFLYTSDPADLEPLIAEAGRRRPTILRC